MSMHTGQIKSALLTRFGPPEWGLLWEVGNATGFATNRHADALAMSLWPSRGIALHGFEIKASRSDWVKELKDPAKAETIAAHCDFWWLVVGAKEIVQPGELPAAWGLLAPKGDKLVCVKEPVQNMAPKPVSRPFLAALFRRLGEAVALPEKEIRQKGYEDGYKRGRDDTTANQRHLQHEHESLRLSIKEFQVKTGVRIDTYNGPHCADEFNRCFTPIKGYQSQLAGLLQQAESIRREIAATLANPPQEICEYVI